MKLLRLQKYLNIFSNLKMAIVILILIAVFSSLGSFIEQDESILFYKETYPIEKPIYGFINSQFILTFGLDHIYRTWWFLSLLIFLGICLISCTITRQLPIFLISKSYAFKEKKKSFSIIPFFIEIQNIYFLKEFILLKIQEKNFYVYQNKNLIYAYKGLIGRISPILVHFSLIIILLGSSIGAFNNFKAQEILPKGELFHIQNPIKVGWFTNIPNITLRVNDFWVEYEKNKIHQFYSNLSILDNLGNEIKEKTISVNNPLKYKNIDFYQSDWNVIALRVKNVETNNNYEIPVFSLKPNVKSWITWIQDKNENYTIIFDQLQNTYLIYNSKGEFLNVKNSNEMISTNIKILEIVPSTGLLIKYDPSIPLIYCGFGLLMITTVFSYLPYTQLWIVNKSKKSWIGALTNRGKIQLEIEFENLTRSIEKMIKKSNYLNDSN